MFTVKFYSRDGYRQIIEEADSFTILREGGEAEITLHRKAGEDVRRDVASDDQPADPSWPPRFAKAIIENSAGRTTEIVTLLPAPAHPDKPKIAA